MPTNDSHQLPWCVVIGFDLTRFSATDEGLREEGGRSVRSGLVQGESGGEVVVYCFGLSRLGAYRDAERSGKVLQNCTSSVPTFNHLPSCSRLRTSSRWTSRSRASLLLSYKSSGERLGVTILGVDLGC